MYTFHVRNVQVRGSGTAQRGRDAADDLPAGVFWTERLGGEGICGRAELRPVGVFRGGGQSGCGANPTVSILGRWVNLSDVAPRASAIGREKRRRARTWRGPGAWRTIVFLMLKERTRAGRGHPKNTLCFLSRGGGGVAGRPSPSCAGPPLGPSLVYRQGKH
eukprot:gene17449-biopygen15908